ncbi:hypothetical protein [Yoonia sp. 2307UL14-13]|uniref:hypothetical protein n=1 Tax=Yoonia sp. 2307UL14-13 TaxID=3126506 RepID=UPI0030ADC171
MTRRVSQSRGNRAIFTATGIPSKRLRHICGCRKRQPVATLRTADRANQQARLTHDHIPMVWKVTTAHAGKQCSTKTKAERSITHTGSIFDLMSATTRFRSKSETKKKKGRDP